MGLDRRSEEVSSEVEMRWALIALRRRCEAGVGSMMMLKRQSPGAVLFCEYESACVRFLVVKREAIRRENDERR